MTIQISTLRRIWENIVPETKPPTSKCKTPDGEINSKLGHMRIIKRQIKEDEVRRTGTEPSKWLVGILLSGSSIVKPQRVSAWGRNWGVLRWRELELRSRLGLEDKFLVVIERTSSAKKVLQQLWRVKLSFYAFFAVQILGGRRARETGRSNWGHGKCRSRTTSTILKNARIVWARVRTGDL